MILNPKNWLKELRNYVEGPVGEIYCCGDVVCE